MTDFVAGIIVGGTCSMLGAVVGAILVFATARTSRKLRQ